jgi:outer membrane protein OmpA-like peptidoglycan-associated protein
MTEAQGDDHMLLNRRGLSLGLANAMLAAGLMLLAGPVMAGDEPTDAQILNALKPKPKTRGLPVVTPEERAKAAEEQQFIDSVRQVRTRSLTSSERDKVATIAKEKPSIDLEIYFDYNSAAISSRSMPSMMSLGRALSAPELKGTVFMIGGHTDAAGGESYNLGLSERRAQAVRQFLIDRFRLTAGDLMAVGYGKEQLKDKSNPLSEQNRRVQVVNMAAKSTADSR